MRPKTTLLILFSLLFIIQTTISEIQEDKIDRKLEAMANPFTKSRVIIFLKEGSQIDLSEEEIIHRFDSSPIVVAELNRWQIERLEKNPSVERIMADRKASSARESALPVVKFTPSVASQYNGTGINISVVDTGVYNHSEFIGPNRLSPFQKCFCFDLSGGCCPGGGEESGNATDDNGHGTNVAGIAAGEFGVGNGSSIIPVKVLDSEGLGYDSDVAKGIEWAFLNGANVISVSMGGCINSSNPDDCYDTCYDSVSSRMVENAVRNGTIVTVAVGNCGPNPTSSCQESGNESISWPSCARGAISVGNTNDNDVISSSSSRGPTDGDSRTKPDLTATGVSVNSTSDGLDSYQTASGTSQSTPFVVGASALIAQKYNETFGYFPSPARVKSILLSSANTTGMRGAGYSQRNDVYGSGRLDIEESLRVINYTRNGTVSTGESRVYRINVSGETRVTLVWDEGITDSNDLNLVVGNLSTNFTNPSSGSDNVEGVIVSNPASGYWTVYVLAANSTNQPFELASNMEIFDDLTPPSLVMESPQNRTYRYNVSIHINFSTDGTNQTIWYDFNGTPETITGNGTFNISSEGTYTFTLSTNDSYDNVNSSSVTLTYIARPGISEQSVDRPVILPNETVNVTAIIDDENLNETLVSITFPNSSEVTAQMVNGSRYYFEFNQTGQYGRYNVTILANDTEGNEANASLQFDVKLPANFSMSASENISFFLLYEGTENQRDSATNSTFYFIVPESLWDMEANTSELTLHFYSANISGSTDSTLSISNVSGQVASQTTLVKGFAVNLTGLDFSLSNMTFAFNQSLVNNASNLLMYKCSDWNGTCQGSWTNDTADSAFNATIGDGNVSIVTEGYSAFALVETIQAATTTTISTTTAPSSGDSGATSSSNTTTSTSTVPQTTSTSSTTIPETTTVAGAYCGDQACQPNENCTSCYADCRCDDKRATIFETASPVKRKIFFALLILAVISIFLILFRLGVRDRIGRLTQKTKPKFKYDP